MKKKLLTDFLMLYFYLLFIIKSIYYIKIK